MPSFVPGLSFPRLAHPGAKGVLRHAPTTAPAPTRSQCRSDAGHDLLPRAIGVPARKRLRQPARRRSGRHPNQRHRSPIGRQAVRVTGAHRRRRWRPASTARPQFTLRPTGRRCAVRHRSGESEKFPRKMQNLRLRRYRLSAHDGRRTMKDRLIIRLSRPVQSWSILTSSPPSDAPERGIPPTARAVSAIIAAPAPSKDVSGQTEPKTVVREDRLPRHLRARLLRPGPYRPLAPAPRRTS